MTAPLSVSNRASDLNLTYLAKDYASFRALMREHLAQALGHPVASDPASTEMALIEVLAYVGDYLSYYQDAVATEAYLETARHRVSVARHARLRDCPLNEGCNARVLVQFITSADGVQVPAGTRLLTRQDALNTVHVPAGFIDAAGADFETMHDASLVRAHNRMALAQPDRAPHLADCHALLAGSLPALVAGDVVVLCHDQEKLCHPVRLTRVEPGRAATVIEWHPGDIGHDRWPAGGTVTVLGNIVLADHGRTVETGYGPHPHNLPDLGFAVPYCADRARHLPVAQVLLQNPGHAEPMIALVARDRPNHVWPGRRDTLRASPDERVFGVEIAENGRVDLRLAAPNPTARLANGPAGRSRLPDVQDTPLRLRYRQGAPHEGAIGAGVIAHVAGGDARITAVHNPQAAVGGVIAEPLETARARVSGQLACPVLHRCVTQADYAAALVDLPDVQSCHARRDGHIVTIDLVRCGGRALDPAYLAMLYAALAPLQLIGDQISFGIAPASSGGAR